ncbi:C-C motif chemokine 25-like isoform X2 [Lissotriton helveticus]
MNTWILISIILASVCVYTSDGQGYYENCCLSYAQNIHLKLLYRHVKSYKQQEINESCNRKAVVFRMSRKGKVVCGDPKEHWVQLLMKRLNNRTNLNTMRPSQKKKSAQQLGKRRRNSA